MKRRNKDIDTQYQTTQYQTDPAQSLRCKAGALTYPHLTGGNGLFCSSKVRSARIIKFHTHRQPMLIIWI